MINGPVTREICPQVDKLRQELAASKEEARLEADLKADRKTLSGMPDVHSVADPQSAALRRLTGIDEDVVRSSMAMVIALLVEFGSALGFIMIILAFTRSVPQQPATAAKDRSQSGSESPLPRQLKAPSCLTTAKTSNDLVTRWALDRLDIVSTGSIQADDAFKDFREWCVVHNLSPLTPQMFGRRFTKVHANMGGRKLRRRGRTYYEGASLQPFLREGRPKRTAEAN